MSDSFFENLKKKYAPIKVVQAKPTQTISGVTTAKPTQTITPFVGPVKPLPQVSVVQPPKAPTVLPPKAPAPQPSRPQYAPLPLLSTKPTSTAASTSPSLLVDQPAQAAKQPVSGKPSQEYISIEEAKRRGVTRAVEGGPLVETRKMRENRLAAEARLATKEAEKSTAKRFVGELGNISGITPTFKRTQAITAPYVVPQKELPDIVENLVGGVTTPQKSTVRELVEIGLDLPLPSLGVEKYLSQTIAKNLPKIVGPEVAQAVSKNFIEYLPQSVRMIASKPVSELVPKEITAVQDGFKEALIKSGMPEAQAHKLSRQGGFLGNWFDTPKVSQLRSQLEQSEALKQKALQNGQKAVAARHAKNIESLNRQIRNEMRGGFVKNPFYKGEPEAPKPPTRSGPQKPELEPPLPPLQRKAASTGQQILEKSSSGESIADNKLFYNYDKLNVAEPTKQKLKQEILKVEDKTEKLIGKKLTHDEWIKRANVIKEGLGKTMTKQEQVDWIARNYNSQRKLAELGKQMEAGQKIDPQALQNIFSEAKSGATFAGRLLESMKEVRDPLSVALLKEMEKAGKITDDILKKAAEIDWSDARAVSEFYRSEVKAGVEEWIDLLRYNSMLSSPNTWLVNISGGLQSLVMQPLTKTVTGLFDFVGTLGGTVRPRSAYAGEGIAHLAGTFKEAGRKLNNLLKKITGKQLPEITKVVDPEYAPRVPLTKPGTFSRAVERSLDWPGRIMQSTDEFFASFVKAAEENALKYRAKKGIQLTAEEIAEKSTAAAKYALFRGGNPEEGKILGAIQHVSDMLSELRQHPNAVVRWPAKFTFPFVNIATQLTKQGIEYSPLGVSTLWGATNKTEQLAKAAMGITTSALVATMLGSDRLTFGRPIGKNQQKAYDDAGMKPYSIKIGNKWIPYSKLHPALAFNFAIVSGIKQAQEEGKLGEDKAEIILTSFARTFNFIADQSYLRNIGDFVAATKGDAQGFARYAANYPAQLVPYRAMLSYVNRLIDYTEREVNPDAGLIEKQMQYIQRQLPYFGQKLPAKVNKDGDPITDDNPWINAISAFGRIGTVDPSGEQYYRNFMELNKMDREKAEVTEEAKKPVQKIYDEAQKLKAAGRVSEANQMVRALSPEQQKIYQSIKSSEKAKNTIETEIKILEIYKKAQALKAEGKVDEANRMVRALSIEEQKAYKLLKEKYKVLESEKP